MMTASVISQSRSKNNSTFSFAFAAVFVTAFLFFIDEGLYNFTWMLDPGAWLVFLIYAIPLFAFQMLSFHFVLARYKGSGKIIMSSMLGIIGGTALVITILTLLMS